MAESRLSPFSRRRPPRRTVKQVTSRAPWRWAVAGALLGAGLVLVTQAPARWLASGVASATEGKVLLGGAQGTVWSGSATLTLTGGTGSHDRTSLPGRLSWQLTPSWLGLRAQLLADCCTPRPAVVNITPQWTGLAVTVQALQGHLPAQLLQGLGAPWNTLQFEGRLGLHSDGLQARWAQGRLLLNGSLKLTASDMASRVSPLRPLGSYELILRGGDQLTVNLSTLGESPLRLQGSGQWVGNRLRFTGMAEAGPGHEAQLSNLLTLIGRRSGSRAVISVG